MLYGVSSGKTLISGASIVATIRMLVRLTMCTLSFFLSSSSVFASLSGRICYICYTAIWHPLSFTPAHTHNNVLFLLVYCRLRCLILWVLLSLNTTFQFSLSSFLKAAHFFNEQTASLNCLNWLTSPTLTGSSVCVWWQFTESTSGLSGWHGSANSPKLAHAVPRNRFRQSTSINTSTSIDRQTVPQTVQLECLLEIFFLPHFFSSFAVIDFKIWLSSSQRVFGVLFLERLFSLLVHTFYWQMERFQWHCELLLLFLLLFGPASLSLSSSVHSTLKSTEWCSWDRLQSCFFSHLPQLTAVCCMVCRCRAHESGRLWSEKERERHN